MPPVISQVFLTLGVATLGAAVAETCDYYSTDECVKADVVASATIPFPTLFSTPPKFVYGADDMSDDDIKTLGEKYPQAFPFGYDGPVQRVAWWLEYDNNTVNFDISQKRHYYVLSLETNSTENIGGSDNGCGDLLGSECVKNLKSLYAWQAMRTGTDALPIYDSILDFNGRPLRNLSCPSDIFGDGSGYYLPVTIAHGPTFATMSEGNTQGANPSNPLPSGNQSFTHSYSLVRLRSQKEFEGTAIIAMTMSWPVVYYTEEKEYTIDDVTVEMACFRLGSVSGGDEDSGSGSRVLTPGILALGTVVALAAGYLLA